MKINLNMHAYLWTLRAFKKIPFGARTQWDIEQTRYVNQTALFCIIIITIIIIFNISSLNLAALNPATFWDDM